MKKIKTDTGLFVKIMWVSYILSTIISAIFNIIMLREIGNTYFDKLIMVLASIALEGVKAATLIKANTFRSMLRKVKTAKLRFAMTSTYAAYLLFAMLSVIAGLGFSMTATAKQESNYSQQIESTRTDISTLELKDSVYKEALELFENLQNNYDEELKQAKENLRAIEDTLNSYLTSTEYLGYFEKNRRYYSIIEEMGANSQEWITWNNDYQIEKTRVLAKEKELRLEVNRATEDLAEIESGKALLRAQTRLETATEDYESYKAEFGDENSLNRELRRLMAEENENLSSGKMFILFANTLYNGDFTANDEPVRMIKFWILLLVSILIEVAIFTCSPDVRVERTLLERFKHHMPDDIDITKTIKIFETEQKKFLYDEPEEKPKVEKKAISKVKTKKEKIDQISPVIIEEPKTQIIETPVMAEHVQITPNEETKKQLVGRTVPSAEDQLQKMINELQKTEPTFQTVKSVKV